MKNKLIIVCVVLLVMASGCRGPHQGSPAGSCQTIIINARQQIARQLVAMDAKSKSEDLLLPVTVKRNRYATAYFRYDDWRSGFFPGTLWYLYELTGDSSLLKSAKKYTDALTDARHLKSHHDIGFIINCSFGNGRRFTDKSRYEEIMVQAARSLCTRFRPKAGVIQSWDLAPDSWMGKRGWSCPVIIDNMMNLELLYEAFKISGDSTFYKVATLHADKTLKEHFRPDGSCYHVIDYNPESGEVLHRQTAQGYADSSAWSRGQAWAIYGFTMCYRETGNRKYLDQAIRTFHFMKNHPNMPADRIPYWDMDAPEIPAEPRDASAAAIIASALYEMTTADAVHAKEYKQYADSIMNSLASAEYTASPGENGLFVLKHSTGSIPHDNEIDVPLNYADYYYMEALKRKQDIERSM